MNIPFQFALHTSTTPIGRLLDYGTASSGYDVNNTLKTIAANTGLGASAAARLAACGIVIPATPVPVWLVGFSITAWYSTDVGAKVDIGLYNVSGTSFIPLYECVAAGVKAGGIQKGLSKYETGFLLPLSSNLIPAIRASNQNGTDGSLTVAGDVCLLPIVS